MLAFFISTFSILPGVFRNSDIGVGFLIVYWVYLVVFFLPTLPCTSMVGGTGCFGRNRTMSCAVQWRKCCRGAWLWVFSTVVTLFFAPEMGRATAPLLRTWRATQIRTISPVRKLTALNPPTRRGNVFRVFLWEWKCWRFVVLLVFFPLICCIVIVHRDGENVRWIISGMFLLYCVWYWIGKNESYGKMYDNKKIQWHAWLLPVRLPLENAGQERIKTKKSIGSDTTSKKSC